MFRQLDAYAKTLDDFRIRTKTGGIVTLVSAFVIALLLVSEWIDYMTPTKHTRLMVETGRKAKMDIYFNLTIPKVPCVTLSLDVMDVSGEHHDFGDLSHDIYKVRLDPNGRPIDAAPQKGTVGDALKEKDIDLKTAASGNATDGKPYCGSCYGATPPASGCCNSCKDIEDAYGRMGWSFRGSENMEQCIREGYDEKMKAQMAEGCNIYGHLNINKVAGNFHLAPGRTFQQAQGHIHDMMALLDRQFDFTHTIHYLSFGPKVKDMHNPLDGVTLQTLNGHSHLIQYFLKVVGTEYRLTNGTTVATNQFSVTEHARDVAGPGGIGHLALPGIFFNYDISPMRVIHEESHHTFMYFLTSVCAVVGGVFTVAGLIDAGLYRTSRALQKKMELGKLN
ncbi:ER-derived vesicles protein erv46 [Blastocladiella emersonii ATCC 22665]|nr:ER-derived vesicles protein erv46 [Blastocladiella emersonii ATCC 22665]